MSAFSHQRPEGLSADGEAVLKRWRDLYRKGLGLSSEESEEMQELERHLDVKYDLADHVMASVTEVKLKKGLMLKDGP